MEPTEQPRELGPSYSPYQVLKIKKAPTATSSQITCLHILSNDGTKGLSPFRKGAGSRTESQIVARNFPSSSPQLAGFARAAYSRDGTE